jgi:hypothetical protein
LVAGAVTELLDRTLIWNQRHLLLTLWEFEHFCNERRPTGPCELPHPTAGYCGVASRAQGGGVDYPGPHPVNNLALIMISIRRYALPGAVPDSSSAPGAARESPE